MNALNGKNCSWSSTAGAVDFDFQPFFADTSIKSIRCRS